MNDVRGRSSPGRYAWNTVKRRVVVLTHVDETFSQGLDEGGNLIDTLTSAFIGLDLRPTWWPTKGRL